MNVLLRVGCIPATRDPSLTTALSLIAEHYPAQRAARVDVRE